MLCDCPPSRPVLRVCPTRADACAREDGTDGTTNDDGISLIGLATRAVTGAAFQRETAPARP